MNTQVIENIHEFEPAKPSENGSGESRKPELFFASEGTEESSNKPSLFFAVRNLDCPSDPNIKFYTNAIDAYAELDRRSRYGIFADVQDRNTFDYEVSRALCDLRGAA